MAHTIRMPALGQTTDEITITSWLKGEGDIVNMGEPLYTVETDKTTLEVESPFAGTVLKIVHTTPATVQAGAAIAFVGAPGEALPMEDEAGAIPATPQTSTPAPIPSTQSSSPAQPPAGKVLATPAARQLAREHGLDLAAIRGSGPDGRIEKEDVLAWLDRT
jgi:pyruvate/2-oxoglutarate dehydrogenase complex dihydrolipoamide acyltransferase (E2) component